MLNRFTVLFICIAIVALLVGGCAAPAQPALTPIVPATSLPTADARATEAQLLASIYDTLTASAPPTADARATEAQVVAHVLATLTASAPTAPPTAPVTNIPTATLATAPTTALPTEAAPPVAVAPVTSDTGATGPTAVCLACHGPFAALIAATASYNAWEPYGETESPHRYVPHDSKDASAIPDCTNCHAEHPQPPTASDIAAMGEVKPAKYCNDCHHEGVLQCGTCHIVPEECKGSKTPCGP